MDVIKRTVSNFLEELRGGGGSNLLMLLMLYGDVLLFLGALPDFWVHFLGCFRIFGYLFGLFPDFWVSFFGKILFL